VKELRHGAGDDLGGAPQVFKEQILVGPLGIGLEDGARTRAEERDGNARLRIEACVGVKGNTLDGRGCSEDAPGLTLQRSNNLFDTGSRP
jgi:hypothetical protein